MKIQHNETMVVNGRLTQIGSSFQVRVGKRKSRFAVFACECGKNSIASHGDVKRGTVISCGCYRNEIRGKHFVTHGMFSETNGERTPTYYSWSSMLERCRNENAPGYQCYGGRGISVCDRWSVFKSFKEDMGDRPAETTLDRIDNSKGYSVDNCRWATATVQGRNRRTNVILTINAEAKTIAEWAQDPMAAKNKTIYERVRRGWTHRESVFGKQNKGVYK
jgi:hypothetical protein